MRRDFLGMLGMLAVGGAQESQGKMSIEQAREFVAKAKFEISPEKLEGEKILTIKTCCVDGRRPKGEKELPPDLALPGADEGMMAILLSVCGNLGFEKKAKEKILEKFIELRGGLKNLTFHTDEHAEHDKKYEKSNLRIAAGCGHFRLSFENLKEYGLEQEDIDIISQSLNLAQKVGAKREILAGEHKESAVMLIDSEDVGLRHETKEGQVFVYNRALVKKLLEVLATKLAGEFNLTAENLNKFLMETSNSQLSSSVKRLAKGRFLFSVQKDQTGNLVVKKEGEVG